VKLHSALIVDEIQEREDGSVDLLGLREDLFFESLPVILERLSLFVELEPEAGELGVRYQMDLRVTDPDGKAIAASPIRFTLPADYPRPTAPLDPTIFEVPFHQYGPHHVEIGLGGETVRSIRLNVYPRESAEA
jgi:hypothetical protein